MAPGQLTSPGPHRLGNVLEGLRSDVVEGEIDLAPDLPIGVIGQTDPAGLGNALEAGGVLTPSPKISLSSMMMSPT
jgi:hypothetical protein